MRKQTASDEANQKLMHLFHETLPSLFLKSLIIITLFSTGTVTAQSLGSSYPVAIQKAELSGIPRLSFADSILPNERTTPHLYRVKYGFTIPFALVATAADLYAIPKILHSKKDLTQIELQALNPSVFNGFDRWALELNPANRDKFYKVSDITLPIIVVSAFTLGFDKQIRSDWVRIFMMYYEMHAVTFTIYNFSFFGPAFQNKFRPVVYYNYFSDADRMGGNQRNSMYSGHVASSAASTFFMVKVYSDYHPELGGKKYLLYGLATIPPLFESYLRVKALAHFPSDCMIGLAIGALTGIVVPELHRYKNRSLQLGLNFSSGGPGLTVAWHPSQVHKRTLKTYSEFNDTAVR